jgi:thioredoxin reductase
VKSTPTEPRLTPYRVECNKFCTPAGGAPPRLRPPGCSRDAAPHLVDEGRIQVSFGTPLKGIHDDEVVLMKARTEEVKATVSNDFIFAMIGGERPTELLEAIGVKIG